MRFWEILPPLVRTLFFVWILATRFTILLFYLGCYHILLHILSIIVYFLFLYYYLSPYISEIPMKSLDNQGTECPRLPRLGRRVRRVLIDLLRPHRHVGHNNDKCPNRALYYLGLKKLNWAPTFGTWCYADVRALPFHASSAPDRPSPKSGLLVAGWGV